MFSGVMSPFGIFPKYNELLVQFLAGLDSVQILATKEKNIRVLSLTSNNGKEF